jgi:hypothetical protein
MNVCDKCPNPKSREVDNLEGGAKMSKRKMLFIPILLLVVGLVGISGAGSGEWAAE